MKKLIILVAIFSLLFFLGCTAEDPLPEDSKFYKLTPIPSECLSQSNDECALFQCMVNNCWCEAGPDAVLEEGNAMLLTEDDVSGIVRSYLQNKGEENFEIMSVADLDGVFFNVFVEIDGQEEVYTVASNGTILKTQCGV